jgi:hypothetical protein
MGNAAQRTLAPDGVRALSQCMRDDLFSVIGGALAQLEGMPCRRHAPDYGK